MKNEFAQASESFKRRNPHLFRPVGQLPSPQPQPHSGDGAGEPHRRKEKGPPRVANRRPRVRVTLIGVAAQDQDSDNLAASFKWLRDAIAADLGLDDADSIIEWQYRQVAVPGPAGVVVRIERK